MGEIILKHFFNTVSPEEDEEASKVDSARARRFKEDLVGNKVDQWLITDYIYHGKAAIVFKASNGTLTAALKIFDPELVERFGANVQEERVKRELSLIGAKHKNLVTIYGGGKCLITNYHYIVMEYIPDSPNLANVLENIPRDRIWKIINQVAEAARFLEDRRLSHRDIKPDNIVIDGGFDNVVLLDLGVLRPFNVSGLTDNDQRVFIGTLQYSSPEYLFREEQDTPEGWRALTFYQLGAVLHDLIMKKRIFSDFADPFARLVEAVKFEIPIINESDTASDLILLANNCLVKDPELRLKLVKWEDFTPRDVKNTHAKERIRKRLIQSQALAGDVDEKKEQINREIKRTLDSIQSKIHTIVRHTCISSELFPPIEINEFQDESIEKIYLQVLVRKSNQYHLANNLLILFEIKLIEPHSRVISITCGTAITGVEVDKTLFANLKLQELFIGSFEEAVISAVVQESLYFILDKAQQIEINQDEPFHLELNLSV